MQRAAHSRCATLVITYKFKLILMLNPFSFLIIKSGLVPLMLECTVIVAIIGVMVIFEQIYHFCYQTYSLQVISLWQCLGKHLFTLLSV